MRAYSVLAVFHSIGMDRTFKLPPRLAAIAALVPDGARLADIGTDHALLPIRLLLDGKIQSAIAADIRPGPLSRAKENACAAMVTNLSCVLCDGLTGISPDSVDTVVIAGMGGETICTILAAAPWLREGRRLILQPQSKAAELADWLWRSGFTIEDVPVEEDDSLGAFGDAGDDDDYTDDSDKEEE